MSDGTAVAALKCGARTKGDGAPCEQDAGARTPHHGQGRCWLHGGLNPIQHGRYSGIRHERIGELVAQFEQDPEPLNMLPEVAAGRALFVDFVERYDEMRDALLAWHASFQARVNELPEDELMSFEAVLDEWEDHVRERGELATEKQQRDVKGAREFVELLRGRVGSLPKPKEIIDIADAHRLLETITRIVERIEKVRAANAISRADFARLIEQMAVVVMKNVDDPEVLGRIRKEWMTIAVR